MPDDQNTTQNPTPAENYIPPSPQEPTEQGTENTAHSKPSVRERVADLWLKYFLKVKV